MKLNRATGTDSMACYLPLVHRWRKVSRSSLVPAEPPAEAAREERREEGRCVRSRGVEARRDPRGVTLSQRVGDVTLHIRHDNPQLGLGDVQYQRLHMGHTHRREAREAREAREGREAREAIDGRESSLTLPLGISSLRPSSLSSAPRDWQSDSEGRAGGSRARHPVSQFYSALAGSTATISQQDLVHYRESRGGRRAKLPSTVPPPRPASVDAELLLNQGEERRMKYAALTSPASYMRQGQEKDEKSSSGNSSASSMTSEGTPHQQVHPALRGRAPAPPCSGGRGPPPRHLLPNRLRPSPLVKLHPTVRLSHSLRQGRNTLSLIIW